MVLRDRHRAAEPDCPAMASDQPLKKKQRTEPEPEPPLGADVVDRAARPVEARATREAPVEPPKPGEGPPSPPFGNVEAFQERLVEQCLCAIEDERLVGPFARRLDVADWPPDEILSFLSNLQLLFDVYLKQNHKGTVCGRLKDARDSLVRNERDWLGEVIGLAGHRDPFVNFAASRAASSFLIVAKDNVDREWLQKIADHLYAYDALDFVNVRKINFSLDVIRRVVEWKDVDQHPLEDGAYINTANPPPPPSSVPDENASSSESNLRNAFSHLHASDGVAAAGSTPDELPVESLPLVVSADDRRPPAPSPPTMVVAREPSLRRCDYVTLTDSESFDTSHVKCLTVRCLERHWPALIENIRRLVLRYLNLPNSENCILSFLSLWENIISVKANLSVIDTKPFYKDFQSFVELLRYPDLPPLIYSQLLSLFNEVLCYGSTLALQDVLPEETCTLAHSIVRFVKDFRLLNEIRMRRGRNGFNFIGFDGPVSVSYGLDSSSADGSRSVSLGSSAELQNSSQSSTSVRESGGRWSAPRDETDKNMLQKMVLLVLKSVAVTVKEMRCDSSDSSIDSTDYNAIQDMQMVERSIRDVLKKLDAFLKSTLEFLPDSPFTKILIHLFSDQDDYLIESMVCTLDITVGIVYRNSVFPDLIPMLNPMATFIEFLEVVSHDSDILLDYLVSNETCFLLYLLRFLKYVRRNWSKFVVSCREVGIGNRGLDDTMAVLIRLRHQITRLVASSLFPYNINPVLRLLELCESLYEGNELS